MKFSKPEIHLGHRASIYAIAVDTASENVYTADGAGMLAKWQHGTLDGALIAQGHSPWFACAYLPETNEIMVGNQAGEICWINPLTTQITLQLPAHTKGVYGIYHGNQGALSLGGDGVLHRWKDKDKQLSVKLSHAAVRSVAEHPGTNILAVGASDSNIYLLDNTNFQVFNVIVQAHVPSVFCVLFSACGKYLLSGGRDAHLCIWSVEDGFELLHRIPAHNYTINDLALSPDGSTLYSASRDRTIKLWDMSNFKLLKVLDAARYSVHTASVNRLAWLGDKLLSVSDDKRFVIWSISRG